MGFMDKVKSAAQDAATQAKKATSQAQTKMEEGQIRKKMDESAKRLGYLVYRERTEGTPAGTEADQAVSEMTALEVDLQALQAQSAAAQAGGTPAASEEPGPLPTTPTEQATPPPATPPSQPSSGDSKL